MHSFLNPNSALPPPRGSRGEGGRYPGVPPSRQQQRHRLQAERAAIDVIPQEEIVDVRDVTRRGRGPVLREQAHQIPELSVQVAEDLGRRAEAKHGGFVAKLLLRRAHSASISARRGCRRVRRRFPRPSRMKQLIQHLLVHQLRVRLVVQYVSSPRAAVRGHEPGFRTAHSRRRRHLRARRTMRSLSPQTDRWRAVARGEPSPPAFPSRPAATTTAR